MEWITKSSSFLYSGTPVTRETLICETPLGLYRVVQAVSGKWFIEYPYISRDQDFRAVMSWGKIPTATKESGISQLETMWNNLKKQCFGI